MSHDLTSPLVIGISSRALFNLEAENKIYAEQGVEAFSKYQREHENDILQKGPAFQLVESFLRLNQIGQERLVEVIIMSRNSPDSSLRVFNSIKQYKLDITRAALVGGAEITPYLKAFKTDLFLSAYYVQKSAIRMMSVVQKLAALYMICDTNGGNGFICFNCWNMFSHENRVSIPNKSGHGRILPQGIETLQHKYTLDFCVFQEKKRKCAAFVSRTPHTTLTSSLFSLDGANAASAAGVPGCGVSPHYIFLYVAPLSVPLYIIYYYIVWRAFLFGLRKGILSAEHDVRIGNDLLAISLLGDHSPYELDTLKSMHAS